MTENVNLQRASWRPRQRSPIFDAQARLIGLAAAGLLAAAAFCYGGYTWLASRPHVVPLVEADPRPLRVRPDNPGGMQVVGADELAGVADGKETMAPPPEVPAPQALRAKINAETRAQSPAQQAPAPLAIVPPAQPPVEGAMTPERPAAVVKPATPVKPVAPPVTGVQVQLGALESELAAMTEWQRLSHRMPDLLASRQPTVQRADSAGRVVFRLRTGGFADAAAATAFCTQVRSKGVGCNVTSL